ncbi:N-acetylmuramoyl-L-alanine amidase [Ligilactobacillus sp. LYQ135]
MSESENENQLAGLWVVILIIISILGYRTVIYFQQVPIQTSDAALYEKPEINSKKESSLAKGSRVKVLKHKYNWIYVKTDKGKTGWTGTWMISPNYDYPIKSLSQATIVIDAGHGGDDSGALSRDGQDEKKYTLKYSKQLAEKLRQKGARVYMTRTNDKTVSLSKRPELAEKVHADAFISFHFDSSPQDNTASGFTTYYYHKNNGSLRLAKDVNSQLDSVGIDNRGVAYGNFLVLRDNDRPAILLESGYINSDRDFSMISDKNYQNKVTSDVAKGLELYFDGKNENATVVSESN